MPSLTVDGQRVEVPDGAYLLEALQAAGKYIPSLCRNPGTRPLGACRTCLVAVDGQRGLPAACSLPAREGMAVRTSGPQLDRVRGTILQLTAAMTATGGDGRDGTSELRTALLKTGTANHRFAANLRTQHDASNPFFSLNMADCILCGRCTDACQEVQHIGAISIGGSGETARVTPFFDGPFADSICTSCGSCVAACPVGALWPKAGRSTPGTIASSGSTETSTTSRARGCSASKGASERLSSGTRTG
jgi:predicted molibdopterin-dependent oxidoreductase YjgC